MTAVMDPPAVQKTVPLDPTVQKILDSIESAVIDSFKSDAIGSFKPSSFYDPLVVAWDWEPSAESLNHCKSLLAQEVIFGQYVTVAPTLVAKFGQVELRHDPMPLAHLAQIVSLEQTRRDLYATAAVLRTKGWIKGTMRSHDGMCLMGAVEYAINGGVPIPHGVHDASRMGACLVVAHHAIHERTGVPTLPHIYNDVIAKDVEDVQNILMRGVDIIEREQPRHAHHHLVA